MDFPPIRMYTLDEKPKGTVFFELLPGRYEGKCWNTSSVYIDEEVFGLIEPLFTKAEGSYDHYAFTDISRQKVRKLIISLRDLGEKLANAGDWASAAPYLGYVFTTTGRRLEDCWMEAKKAIIFLCASLADWLERMIVNYDFVAVLGI